ncbi:endonuclease/exonuclease/phosphatase family protein [Sphingomonas sp. FW199]|uniref:endonuclease/exonuclease/phosphatase family protein n=1 Tax=Sphingomonas sp. FW199 TaxID=3400217 RepID=UPI003CE8BB91
MMKTRAMARFAAPLFLAVAAGCCVSYPVERRAELLTAPPAVPAAVTLSVMSYNLEGLTWPARVGRRPFLAEITQEFARMKAAGELHDVIGFQEACITDALRTAATTPLANLALGPRAPTPSGLPKSRDPVIRKRNYLRGEWGIRFMGSGLAIASRYPIIAQFSQPYGPTSCAGCDCLANKRVLLVRIVVPGLPDPVEIATTHMNAQGASKAPPEKHLAAHNAQSAELANFLDKFSTPQSPLVLAGDFNMRRSPARLEAFQQQNG